MHGVWGIVLSAPCIRPPLCIERPVGDMMDFPVLPEQPEPEKGRNRCRRKIQRSECQRLQGMPIFMREQICVIRITLPQKEEHPHGGTSTELPYCYDRPPIHPVRTADLPDKQQKSQQCLRKSPQTLQEDEKNPFDKNTPEKNTCPSENGHALYKMERMTETMQPDDQSAAHCGFY